MIRLFLVIVVLTLLSACAEEREPPAPALDLESGKALAEKHCSACHAPDGRGRTSEIPNLAAQESDYLFEAMLAYREGRRHHAALQDLIAGFSPTEIRNIAGFFASLPALPRPAETDGGDDAYQRGEQVAAACTGCHGKSGFSTAPGVPSLAGQQPVYLMIATQEYASGNRGQAAKEAMLSGLGQVDIEKMALFFASQATPQRDPPPFGDSAAGEPLTASCGACHGARGISHDPMIPSLAGQEPNYLVAAIRAYRDHERDHEDMIANKSDEEIEDIAAYYSVQQLAAAIDAGESVLELAAKCDRCHGPAAQGKAMAVPSLNGQSREYMIRVMKQYRDDDRGSSMMHKMSASYSDSTIEAIAGHYAARPSD